MNMEQRVGKLEQDSAVMKNQLSGLIDATKENTVAVRDLTSKISFNSGVFWASLKWSAFMTVVIGGAITIGAWLVTNIGTIVRGLVK